ncbi:MAG TPA: adenylate/guanylate cyclase domain-containing protein [Chloroflexia bacterium]|jgi:PAS domain S-box-containing protein|nr:adenylate/guanylate cyclase domain-containing protein [Chloroflexia bacterium]
MDETLTDPIAVQRVELQQLEQDLSTLTRLAGDMLDLLRRSSNPGDIGNAVAGLAPALQEQVRTAQQHRAAAALGLDAIARLAESRRQEAHHLRTLYTIVQAVNSTLDLRALLNLVMDKVIEVTKAERGYVVLRDEQSGALTVAAARGMDHGTIDSDAFLISRGIVTQVATSGQPVLTTNAQADPRFSAMESVMHYNLRAILCAPLMIRGQVQGVVYVDNRLRTGLFTPRDLDLLVNLANQAAFAIDNARMYGYMANVLASIASGVVTTDEYGIIRTYNRAAAGIFGIQPEQAMGQSYRDVFGLLANSPVPALFNQVQESGEPVLGHEARVVVPGRGEVTLLLNVARVVAETGEKLGVVVVIEDITQERRMERYIAPNVVEHLITASAGPKLGGELRDITVLFGDVQGYTTLSEKMAPEELIDLLNTHLSLAGSTIMDPAYEGTLDKYIGDAVMGLFNTPGAQEDHAWRAVNAAWAMQTRLREFQDTLPPERHLRFRVGVHTGKAVVGHIGSENLMNFTAIGDAVNVAKRLQESARPGQVVLSEDTYRAIDPDLRKRLEVRPLGFISLKGRAAEVPAYELLGVNGG